MKKKSVIAGTLLALTCAVSAMAVPPGKVLEYKESPMGTVIFDGTVHKNAGLTCKDCHNEVVFPEMRKGGVKMTMKDLYAGKYCGRCHDGKKAFQILDNCTRCHHKSESGK